MALRLDRLSDLTLAPHHDGSPLYVSNSAAALGDTVQVRVRVPQSFGPVTEVRTRSNPDHEPVFTTATLLVRCGQKFSRPHARPKVSPRQTLR